MSEFFGLYRGSVQDINDPERRGRLRALVPAVLGDAVSAWAEPMLPPAEGLVWAVGDRMWMQFEDGDINRPVYLSRLEVRREDLSPEVTEDIETAVNLAERAATTFSGAADPALTALNGVRAGDLWLKPIETTDAEGEPTEVYVLFLRNVDNSAWDLVADENALSAIRTAQAAANLADGKMRIFHEPAAPDFPFRPLSSPVMKDPEDRGDLWFNESDKNKPLTWDGPIDGWQSAQDVGIVPGTRLAADAVDGKTVTGALMRTAAPFKSDGVTPNNRIEIKPEADGGRLEAYSGDVSEDEPSYLDAGMILGDTPLKRRMEMLLSAGRFVNFDYVPSSSISLTSASVDKTIDPEIWLDTGGDGRVIVYAIELKVTGEVAATGLDISGPAKIRGKLDLVTGGSRPVSTMLFGSISVTTNGQGVATHSPDGMNIQGPYQVFYQSRLNGATRRFNTLEKNPQNFKFTVKNAADDLVIDGTGITLDYWIVAE